MSFSWFISIVIHRLNENPLMQILKKALSFLVNDVCGRLYLTKHDLVKTVIINSRFLCIFKICKFSLTLVFSWTLGNDVKHHRDHSYSTCANFSKKLPFLPSWCAHMVDFISDNKLYDIIYDNIWHYLNNFNGTVLSFCLKNHRWFILMYFKFQILL